MKILLTGASGLLGNAYANAAVRRGHTVTALYHCTKPIARGIAQCLQIDARELDQLSSLTLELWPDVIVNCAAISSPADVDAEPELAEKINVALPRHLSQLSAHLGCRLLHISTDMVFDGHAEGPYRSTDMPCPTSLYGQTKLMAERAVLEHNSADPVVLRIPILMGNSPRGNRSVHEKLLTAIARGETPKVFCDEIRQPCTASNIAEVLLELSERRDLHGIFHWAGAEPMSRFEMAQRILKHFKLPLHSVQSTCQGDDPKYSARPSNLTFNLNPIVSKLKTKPAPFDLQLEELTYLEPLRASDH